MTTLARLVVLSLLGAAAFAVPPSAAQGHSQHPSQPGQGMMGCPMMGHGMGPSMMGQGMAPGMMGPGMMGSGMMGPTMGPGMVPGVMGPGMMGWGWGAQPVNLNLSANDVQSHLERWIAMTGNPHVKLGSVTEKDDTITAEIVTTGQGDLVQRFAVDRRTGIYSPVQ